DGVGQAGKGAGGRVQGAVGVVDAGGHDGDRRVAVERLGQDLHGAALHDDVGIHHCHVLAVGHRQPPIGGRAEAEVAAGRDADDGRVSSAYGCERAVERLVVDHNDLLHTVVA